MIWIILRTVNGYRNRIHLPYDIYQQAFSLFLSIQELLQHTRHFKVVPPPRPLASPTRSLRCPPPQRKPLRLRFRTARIFALWALRYSGLCSGLCSTERYHFNPLQRIGPVLNCPVIYVHGVPPDSCLSSRPHHFWTLHAIEQIRNALSHRH